MPQQRGFQSERPAAIVAQILTGTRSADDYPVLDRGHRTEAPSVHRDTRRRRQGGYCPIGRTVCRTCESRKEEMKLSLGN